jgi:hypothetical protein
MDRPPLEVADLVRAVGGAFIERSRKWITWKHLKVLLAIARCRTAALDGISMSALAADNQLRDPSCQLSCSAAPPQHTCTPTLHSIQSP